MTPGEVSKIDELTKSLNDLRRTIERRNALRRVLAVLAGLALVVLLYSSLTNRVTLSIVRDAVDPTSELAQRGRAAQQTVLVLMQDDIDCRAHRRDAGMSPPPDAYKPCRDQTPPEVYTGPPLTPPPTPPGR